MRASARAALAGSGVASPRAEAQRAGARPMVLLTGYWPPTNEMIRHFSPDPAKNPAGWAGADWEGRGYDVVAIFPEFSNPNCTNCGQGMGDMEVDYQDTLADFFRFADGLAPIAVITTSRGFPDRSWELEMNQFNRSNWFPDFSAPVQPTPSPPDASRPAGHLRASVLPVQEIVERVAAAVSMTDPAICYTQDGGGFLSEYAAFLGVWYQSLHPDPALADWCVAAGHVHVGSELATGTARLALEETLRTTLDHVDRVLGCQGVEAYCQTAPNSVGAGAILSSTGSTSIAANDLELVVQGLPPDAFGVFFFGQSRFERQTLGDGFRCVRNPLFRIHPPRQADAGGLARLPLRLDQPPFSSGAGATAPGSFRAFQFLYRDPTGGPDGFNTSNGLWTLLCP